MSEYRTQAVKTKEIVILVAIYVGISLTFGFLTDFDFTWVYVTGGVGFVLAAFVLIRLQMEKQARRKSVAEKRPGAPTFEGKSPAVMGMPPTAPEKDLKKAENYERNVILVATPDAFEIWASPDVSRPMRSLQNTADVTFTEESRDFGEASGDGGGRTTRNALVITGRNGEELVFHTEKPKDAYDQIRAAKRR